MTSSSASAPELVDTPEQLTPSWLTTALRIGGLEVTVSGVSHRPVGTGQMSNCYRLALEYSQGEGPATLIAKLPSDDRHARIGRGDGNLIEVQFYLELHSTVAIRAPACSYADVDDKGTSFVMLLEDLAPAEQGDQILGCSVDQARDAVVNLAGLHGPRWCDKSLRDLQGLVAMTGRAQDITAIVVGQTEKFITRFAVTDSEAEVLRTFALHAGDWVLGRTDRFGLLHGDYRLDNLTFATSLGGYPCAAVDWQLLTVGLPARDLGLFLGTCMKPSERAQNEHSLVTTYHDALAEYGVRNYSLDECLDDYRWGLFHGPLLTVLGGMQAPQTERGDQMFATMSERSCAAIRDHEALSLL